MDEKALALADGKSDNNNPKNNNNNNVGGAWRPVSGSKRVLTFFFNFSLLTFITSMAEYMLCESFIF